MIKFAAVLIGALLITSCASDGTYPLPDGRTGYIIGCDGVNNSMAACLRYAAKTCGGKYEVISQNESVGTVGVNGIIAPKPIRSLQFACPAT